MTTHDKQPVARIPVADASEPTPFPSVILKQVAWNRGGATIDGKPGEPWPWGDQRCSPCVMRYHQRFSVRDVFVQEKQIWSGYWRDVEWYCDPKDLAPPKGAER